MPLNVSEKKLFDYLEQRAIKNPAKPLAQQTIEEFRASAAFFQEFSGQPTKIPYQDLTIAARDGYSIPIRIYNGQISNETPVLIMYPGCGYIQDAFQLNAVFCSRIADYSGIKVILIDFRLAPEFPLPTAIYDAYDATRFIATHPQQFSITAKQLVIGGLSSGAHCAAVVANLAREDKQLHISQQILVNGVYDLTQSQHGYEEYEKEDKLLTREVITYIYQQFGLNPEDFSNPLFSPCYETDLSGLPPTTFLIGEYDGARNDSEAYYLKIKNAGNNVTKIMLPGQTHNTIILREAMHEGEDPAKIIAEVIAQQLAVTAN